MSLKTSNNPTKGFHINNYIDWEPIALINVELERTIDDEIKTLTNEY